MTTLLLTIVIIGVLMLGMAVGVILNGRELKGSCGGSGAEDCFCERNNLPRACEQIGADLPDECSDHEHQVTSRPAGVHLTHKGITITK